jgi:hypothetical protein
LVRFTTGRVSDTIRAVDLAIRTTQHALDPMRRYPSECRPALSAPRRPGSDVALLHGTGNVMSRGIVVAGFERPSAKGRRDKLSQACAAATMMIVG